MNRESTPRPISKGHNHNDLCAISGSMEDTPSHLGHKKRPSHLLRDTHRTYRDLPCTSTTTKSYLLHHTSNKGHSAYSILESSSPCSVNTVHPPEDNLSHHRCDPYHGTHRIPLRGLANDQTDQAHKEDCEDRRGSSFPLPFCPAVMQLEKRHSRKERNEERRTVDTVLEQLIQALQRFSQHHIPPMSLSINASHERIAASMVWSCKSRSKISSNCS